MLAKILQRQSLIQQRLRAESDALERLRMLESERLKEAIHESDSVMRTAVNITAGRGILLLLSWLIISFYQFLLLLRYLINNFNTF